MLGLREEAPWVRHSAPRRFAFVPLWGIAVFLVYARRRVDCPRCGVVVESVPWADGKARITHTYAWFLAGWAKRLSWKEVASAFNTSWDTVFRSVEMAVTWGLPHRDLDNVATRSAAPDASDGNPDPYRARDLGRLMRVTLDLDLLTCKRCGGRMGHIATILDPHIARNILEHLGKPARAPPQASPRDPPPFWPQAAQHGNAHLLTRTQAV